MAKEKKKRSKRVQVLLKYMLIFTVVIVGLFSVFTVLTLKTHLKEKEIRDAETAKQEAIEAEQEAQRKAKEHFEEVKATAIEQEYPEKIIELLDKNPETVDFVEKYQELKDSEPVETIEELKDGAIPKLLQWDPRWGYTSYGNGTIATSGCGPTCVSMVVAGLTGDNTATPAKMGQYAVQNGYLDGENNTAWAYMVQAPKSYGIDVSEEQYGKDVIFEKVESGAVIVCSVGPGVFTEVGHFIVIAGVKDGKLIVHDPFNTENSSKLWDFEEFEDQIKAMWTYTYTSAE